MSEKKTKSQKTAQVVTKATSDAVVSAVAAKVSSSFNLKKPAMSFSAFLASAKAIKSKS